MGANFCGKSEKALKINFCGFKFVTATSPGAWHCKSDDVIDTRTRFRSRFSLLLSHTYRNLDKLHAIDEY